jgi:hypothetical protein
MNETINMNTSKTLTVVVLDGKSQPTSGANVYITPLNTSGITNNSGEVQFTLGNDSKYEVTATADGKTVTVPYYVTDSGATRLVVNPVYVKRVEQQLHPLSWFSSGVGLTTSIVLGVIIVFVIVRKLFRRKK